MPRTLEVRHFHGRATVRRTVTAAATMVLLVGAACGSETAPPEATTQAAPIPADALPGTPGEAVALDVQAVAAAAIASGELETLLRDAGFEGGWERGFSKATGGRRRMLARVLEFENAAGAERYVRWLSDHVEEVIGDASRDPDLEAPDGGAVFVHEPDPCCHNETRIFLAIWSAGERAITLEIAGQAARASGVNELVARLDAAM
jgi:hypothetical protein